MTNDQAIAFGVLSMTLVLFAWGKWRYDIVAAAALFTLVAVGIVDAQEALLGFGHPAVITVAAVLVISRALRNSGAVSLLARQLKPLAVNPTAHVLSLCVVVAVCSAFMNNVGALALLLPVALKSAAERKCSPAIIMMPLAFASILGGMVTMIGTPPNIIIATYRGEMAGADSAFGMFDFSPVGGVVAIGGVLFVALGGWRLIPRRRDESPAHEALAGIGEYITEVRIPETSKLIGERVGQVEELSGERLELIGRIDRGGRFSRSSPRHAIEPAEEFLVKADPAHLSDLLNEYGLELTKSTQRRIDNLETRDHSFVEAVVTPGSLLVGRDRKYLRRRSAGAAVLLAIARQGRPIRRRMADVRFRAGDVLLLQGEEEDLDLMFGRLGLLTLEGRDLAVVRFGRIAEALAIFAVAIGLAIAGWLSTPIAFLGAVVAYVVTGILPAREIYREIDWPIIVLLGALIPVSGALSSTGGSALMANGILQLTSGLPAVMVVGLVMVATMCLSDVINNAATALVMAPVAVQIGTALNASPDPFLMAVAVGASCAFLTPIGHQSNALVMGPGGYHFGDYWRMGLPLEILIVMVATPLILVVWPL